MYAKYGHPENNYVAALYEYKHGDVKQYYAIAFHYGEMPAYNSKVFDTLEQAKSWAREHLGITHWRGADGQFTSSPD